MAFTVVTDLQDVDLAESATPWTTGSLDPDKFVQGSNSIGWYAAKNGRQVNGVSSKSINWTAGDHLYSWQSSDVASKMEAQTTGTTTASGVTIRVTLSGGAYREWHVAGSDTWDGGWRCFVVDLGHTGTHLYASSGIWSTANNITDVDIYYDLSNSGNIRNVPANCYADAIRVGTGITAYNTSAADPSFDLIDIATNDNLVANKRGILEIKDGVIFAQGRVTIGDSGTNHCDFDSQNETFVFSLRDGTDGFGLVGDTLYQLNFQANATGTDQDFNFGVKVGTGDTATGRSGSTIQGQGAVRYTMNWDDADIHNFTMYGSTIRGAWGGTSGTSGVVGGTTTTSHEIIGDTFDACGRIDSGDAVVRNINVLNSQETGATHGAFLWTEADVDIKNSLFVNNTNAIDISDGLSADMTLTGITFSGNTFDLYYVDTQNWNANISGGTVPSIDDTDGTGTLTAVASVDYSLVGMNDGTELTVLDRSLKMIDITGTATALSVGNASATERAGQSFQVASTANAERIKLNVRKVGTPTDGITIRLVNGVPGSTLLAESLTLYAEDITTSFVAYDIDLNRKTSLTASTTYGIEIQRTGAVDAANYYQIEYSTTSVDATGTRYNYNAGWSSTTGDLLLAVMESASDHELFHVESSVGIETYTHGGVAKEVEVLAMHLNYLPIALIDTLQTVDSSITLTQSPDRVFSNP